MPDHLHAAAIAALKVVQAVRRHLPVDQPANECRFSGKAEIVVAIIELERVLNPDRLGEHDPARRAPPSNADEWSIESRADWHDIREGADTLIHLFGWPSVYKIERLPMMPVGPTLEYWPQATVPGKVLTSMEDAAKRIAVEAPEADPSPAPSPAPYQLGPGRNITRGAKTAALTPNEFAIMQGFGDPGVSRSLSIHSFAFKGKGAVWHEAWKGGGRQTEKVQAALQRMTSKFLDLNMDIALSGEHVMLTIR